MMAELHLTEPEPEPSSSGDQMLATVAGEAKALAADAQSDLASLESRLMAALETKADRNHEHPDLRGPVELLRQQVSDLEKRIDDLVAHVDEAIEAEAEAMAQNETSPTQVTVPTIEEQQPPPTSTEPMPRKTRHPMLKVLLGG
jgi:DNA repair exonuclease SbcCD ATPase subunit